MPPAATGDRRNKASRVAEEGGGGVEWARGGGGSGRRKRERESVERTVDRWRGRERETEGGRESNPPPRRRRRHRAVSVALDIPLAAPLFPYFSLPPLSRSLTASDCLSLSLPPRRHFASSATSHPSSSSPTVRSPTSPSSLCGPVEDSRESSSSARPKFTRRDRDPRRRRREPEGEWGGEGLEEGSRG